ncbi:MAG: hypothetical protein PHR28_14340, partial [candidate division Zixibacteria bacterium]|nr:hypothetical protein [candidate division Zixibacteria bacterium]
MRLIFAAIICIFVNLPVASAYAREGMGMAGCPADTGAIATAKDDSTKTTTPPPTFRINNPQEETYGPKIKPVNRPRTFKPLGPGRTITCLSMLVGIGQGSGMGPAIILSRSYSRHVAVGLALSSEFPNGKVFFTPLGVQIRVYPEPSFLQYYLFTELGIDVNMGNVAPNESLAKPSGRLGLGI